MKKILLFVFLLSSLMIFSQEGNKEIIQQFLNLNQERFELSTSDIQDWIVTNEVYSKKSGITHVYIQQQYDGVPIFNAVANVSIKNGKVIHHGISFIKDVTEKANTKAPNLTPVSAIQKVATQLELTTLGSSSLLKTVSEHHFVYRNESVSSEKIPVKLVYQPTSDNQIRLAWQLNVFLLNGLHWWDIRVDANTGIILDKNDWRAQCRFDSETGQHYHIKQKSQSFSFKEKPVATFTNSHYNVFALPVESPIHGNRSMVSNPSDTNASPFGWHDTDGVEGAEYTITRGNNVYVQLDDDGFNFTEGVSPDGGANLTFDFPIDFSASPNAYSEAAMTNLFYANNILHDILYQYGFDEQAGNFQENNYDRGGEGADYVIADAQDGSFRNNAIFYFAPEGTSPRMEMYLFDSDEILTVNTGSVAGSYLSNEATFYDGFYPLTLTGAPVYDNPVTADLVLINDETTNPMQGCGTMVTNDVSGKIVLIQRGNCTEVSKVELAQANGASGVIIMNNEPGNFRILDINETITIPVITISQEDGDLIANALNAGESLNSSLQNIGLDSSFDNALIAHEYGHGISSRLIGGASTVSCVNNAEQLGEGWSDFFGFIITIEPDDAGDDPRGIGTYLFDFFDEGNGFREYLYSTDMTVNPLTLADVEKQFFDDGRISVHGVGTVWATMLWDLTWAMIDEYGFDPNIYYGDGGNNKTLELVMEGLKLTPCDSGFEAARDAILAADEAINGGANACLIWRVFARRGLGYSASSGSANSILDQIAAFDMPPTSVLNCTLSVSEEYFENFKIFPNPSNGSLSISVVNPIDDAVISIFDLNGREVFTDRKDIVDTVQINADKLATGMYILKITNGTVNFSQKVLIE